MTVAERLRIWPLPTEDYISKYGHPNGWRIIQCERSWSERVGAMRGASLAGPKRWWEVHREYRGYRHAVETFPTLREARAWCDEHERKAGT